MPVTQKTLSLGGSPGTCPLPVPVSEPPVLRVALPYLPSNVPKEQCPAASPPTCSVRPAGSHRDTLLAAWNLLEREARKDTFLPEPFCSTNWGPHPTPSRTLETWGLRIYQLGLPGPLGHRPPPAGGAGRPGCVDARAKGGQRQDGRGGGSRCFPQGWSWARGTEPSFLPSVLRPLLSRVAVELQVPWSSPSKDAGGRLPGPELPERQSVGRQGGRSAGQSRTQNDANGQSVEGKK